jgi:phosphatidylserine/phosphatidylglycerophosphate/cardiolipin synthase-like enzyme
MSPSAIPEEPNAVPVRVGLDGAANASYELKAWVGSPDRQASRTWNGSDWHRSDHYVRRATTGGDGRWEGWVGLRVNPSSAGYEALVDDADETGLHVRARPADGGEAATASRRVRVLDPANVTWRTGRAGDGAYVAAGSPPDPTSLAAVAPDPRLPAAPADGVFRLPVPASADPQLVRLDAAGAVLGPVQGDAAPPLRLAEAVPHAYGADEPGEAVAVVNAGNRSADLAGVCLEAGGRACLEGGALAPGATLWLARNASAYEAATGREARAYPPALDGDGFGLPDGAGTLALTYLGERLDAVAWGEDPGRERPSSVPRLATPRPGEVLRREPTGSAGDRGGWSGGTRLGQTRLDPATYPLERRAWTAVAPGSSYDLMAGLIREAEARIQVEAYLLTSPSLGHELARALDRGVDVDVLVEGSPVGGRPGVEDRILSSLASRGADVRTIASTPSFQARYPSVHAKAVVVDGETVVVGTENLATSGFPPGGVEGNRGWVVAVADRDLAGYVERVLEADAAAARPDVHPVDGTGESLPPPPVAPPPELPDPVDAANGSATPVVSPDTSRHALTVLGAMGSAEATLDVQLLSVETPFDDGSNPYVAALLEAARRGVQVRVLLDATYTDEATGELENAPAREALEAAARAEDLPLEVRYAGRLDVAKVHTKGVLVDGEEVVVGSINWVEAALDRNRELGLVVDAPAVAGPFQEAFDRDWRRSLPSAGVVPPVPGFGAATALAAGGLAALLVRRR